MTETQKPTIICMTTDPDRNMVELALAAGISEVVDKQLLVGPAFLNRFIGQTVIVVDDAPWTTSAIANLAERVGLPVTTYNDPEETLAAIIALHPDIVLTDFKMPGMSGIELTQKIRAHSTQGEK